MSRGASVTLGGKERTLRFTLTSAAKIGDKLGIRVRLDHLREDLLGVPLPLSALSVFLWAGLVHESPELTVEEAGDMVDQDNLVEVIQVFSELFGLDSWLEAIKLAMAEAAAGSMPESETKLQAV